MRRWSSWRGRWRARSSASPANSLVARRIVRLPIGRGHDLRRSQRLVPKHSLSARMEALDARVHGSAPEGRDECGEKRCGVARGELGRAREGLQLLVRAGGPTVMIAVAPHVEQGCVVHPPRTVPGMFGREALRAAIPPEISAKAIVG